MQCQSCQLPMPAAYWELAWHAVAFCGEQLDRSRAKAEI